MSNFSFSPQEEVVTPQPTYAKADYLTRFTFPCRLTYSDNAITSIYEGTGISPDRHPLQRQFAMLRLPIWGCGSCNKPSVSVVYICFTRPLTDDFPGDIICIDEVFCSFCEVYTGRQFVL
ncbi:MAG: hypothetical protein SAJ12_20095 [Jaaginema sp. PMC 1079.18]|nr:hypothetical protein [Jaaginema sp. PMC 1080.18]MEC4853289.1 hypothetical protein [Jaaginema sp. PMC 1079.18]MEC4868977.1 hypothetical protein [Jaaginema sp. PMC 1078.18]